MRILLLSTITAGLSLAVTLSAAESLEPTQHWEGSARNEGAVQSIPKVITSAVQLKKAWNGCERTDPVPEIDLKKFVVVVETTTGSKLHLRARITDGELSTFGMATRDIRPGLRYVIATFPREGLKKANRVEL